MSVDVYRTCRANALGGVALLTLLAIGSAARAQDQPPQNQAPQNQPAPVQSPDVQPAVPPSQGPAPPSAQAPAGGKLPQINVTAPIKKPPAPRQAVQRTPPPAALATVPPISPAEQLTQKQNSFDQARSNLFTTIGTTSDTLTHNAIQSLPQGTDQPAEKVLLQFPGVSQDSAAAGSIHIRNDHANAQVRINGILMPDGVTGFSSFIDPAWIGSLSLITGALPAEYGLRTTGVIDITTRTDLFNNSGSIGVYGGSRGTITPSIEYGGTFGANCPARPAGALPPKTSDCYGGVQYFFTGRYLQTQEGIENPLPTLNAIHDFSRQEKGFAYLSTFVDPWTRLTMMMGTSTNTYQIPNVPNAQPFSGLSSAFGVTSFDSTALKERQDEDTQFGVVALQRSVNGFDGQLSYFTRYDNLHFMPDPVGDLFLNGIASDISRQAYTNGVQGDASYVLTPAHTLRMGFTVSAEKTWVDNTSWVEALDPANATCSGGAPCGDEPPFRVTDDNTKVGWLAGIYAQDEWKITNNLTMNYGARFDQMWQYTNANQLSPRVSFTYKPFENTTFHIGYARYFTPPIQVEAAPANVALFAGTTGAPPGTGTNPVLPERSHVFDAGIDQKVVLDCYSSMAHDDCTTLNVGIDGYYKIAKDLIDNGQFGQALLLSGFNYAHGLAEGVELSAKFHSGHFDAYANIAVSEEKASQVVTNQYLFDNTTPIPDLGGLTEFQYIQNHWIFTDHNQFVTGSAGASYQFCGRATTQAEMWWTTWCGTKLTADMFYGSGLRTGDANIGSLRPYEQFNVGVSREFAMPDNKPLTLRFDVVNLADEIYQIRNGSGIGVFASQFGPRRGYYFGISKKL